MRKHFAMEAEQIVVRPVLALEEEEVIIDEAQTDGAEVATDLAEAERIVEVSDALEDLAVIADGIEEATPTEVALIENAGQMAVAGSDVEPEEVVPQMTEPVMAEDGTTVVQESFIGRKISTEGIREVARTIWENVKKFLKSIWEKITRFFHNIVAGVPRLQASIKSLKASVEAAKEAGKKAEGKIEVSSGVAALSINGAAVTTGATLKKGLQELVMASKYVFESYAKSAAARGYDVAKAIASFDPMKPQVATEAAIKACGQKHFETFGGKKELLGNVVLKTSEPVKLEEGLSALERCRKEGVVLEPVDKAVSTASMDVLSFADLSGLLDSAENLLSIVDGYENGSGYKSLLKAKTELEAAGAKAATAMAAAKDAGGEVKPDTAAYKALLNFNLAFAKGVYQPAAPMVTTDLKVVRAVIALVVKSLAAYKVEKAPAPAK